MSLTNYGSIYIKVPQRAFKFNSTSIDFKENLDQMNYKYGTFAVWAKPSGSACWIMGNGAQFRIQAGASTASTFWIKDKDGNSDDVSGGPNTLDTGWHHFVGVYEGDGGDMFLYIDGVEVATKSPGLTDMDDGSNNFTIGEQYKGGNSFFSGSICEVRIYSGNALTADEVKQLYNGINLTTNLHLHWKFDEQEGTYIEDEIYGITGNAVGTADWTYRDIRCWNSRWDESNYTITIEAIMDACDRNYLYNNVVPGAVREQYKILGQPTFIDTTYSSGNTLTIEPISGYGISSLRQTRRIGVKSISDSFLNKDIFDVKIEGVRLDVS